MARIEHIKPAKKGQPRRIRVYNPATNDALGEITVTTAEEVRAAVKRARVAQKEWAERSVDDRVEYIKKALQIVIDRQDELLETIMADTGRGKLESIMMEIIAVCDVLHHVASHAPKMLADHKVPIQTLLKAKKLMVTYRPLGVVGIITPWNGPFVMSINPAAAALAAGNAVIVKPSEVTPFAGRLIADVFAEAGLPDGLLQVLDGDGETGAALVEAGVDKISFTGSTRTGRKVGEACGRNLIPCTLELGGKDAMIVCSDADLERASGGAVSGSMFNTGQFCCATERCYVVDSVADTFIQKVVAKTEALKQGHDGTQDVSSMIWPDQLDVIQSQVDDAVQKGARILVGGGINPKLGGAFFEPTILVDVNHSMEIMREETFGPVLPIMRVRDEDEAIALANDSIYGLSGTVWCKNEKKALAIAKRIQTGSVCINETSLTYGAHAAPFGGTKNSGVGHVHGEDGLRNYSQPVPIISDRLGLKHEHNWYPMSEDKVDGMLKAVKFLYGTKVGRWLSR